MTRIEEFGWRGEVAPGIGRVVSAHGDYYHLVCNEAEGEILARKKKSAFTRMKTVAPDSMKGAKRSEVQAAAPLSPITGDFVKFRHNAQGDSMILEVLPRFSHFERKDPTARRTSQTLAVNFDALFVMMSLNENFSTARVDRYLTLAEDMGEAEAVVVLTKTDLWQDGDEEFVKELEDTIAGRARLLRISCLTGEGMDSVLEYARQNCLEVGKARLGFRNFRAVFVPCKEQVADSRGRVTFLDTPSDVQRRKYLSLIKDEMDAQEKIKQDLFARINVLQDRLDELS